MKQIFAFSLIVVLIVIFGACSDDSNPVTSAAPRIFDPFAMWDTANTGLSDTFVFAGTTTGSIFRSSNSGDTWTSVNTGLGGSNIRALLVKDSVLYAGTDDGVYLSTNDGSNWTTSSTGMEAGLQVFSLITKDSIIFAGTEAGSDNRGVYYSIDNGVTWTPTGLAYGVNTLCVKGKNLFAGTVNVNNSVYRSTNNGANWNLRDYNIPVSAVNSLAAKDTCLFAATATTGGVYRSSNDSSWTAVRDGLYSVSFNPEALFVYGPNILAGFGNFEGIYLSLNNGASWVSANAGLFSFSAYAFTYNGTYIFVGGTDGVWRHAL
jgi:hypothetical protein